MTTNDVVRVVSIKQLRQKPDRKRFGSGQEEREAVK